jgi:nucleoside-diphosphate-sugar epimerase/dTDP-4-amino-4,6-dideoxygalactose transaminase/CBS domain-containing protein
MVDKLIIPNLPDWSLIESDIKEIYDSRNVSTGKWAEKVEEKIKEIHGCKYALLTSSGTMALMLLLKSIDYSFEKIYMQDFTWNSTKIIVESLFPGMVEYVDVDEETWLAKEPNLDKGLFIPTMTFGSIKNYSYPFTIYDSAHCLGNNLCNGRGFGEIFSCSPAKNISGMEGGVLITNDIKIYEKAKNLRRYIGRITEFNARVLYENLIISKKIIENKNNTYQKYLEGLNKDFKLQKIPLNSTFNEIGVLIPKNRNELIEKIKDLFEIRLRYEPTSVKNKVSNYLYNHILILPSSKEHDINKFILRMNKALEEVKLESDLRFIKLTEKMSLFIIEDNNSIKEAMKKIDLNGLQFICVVNDKKEFKGIATDGDIRRALIKGVDIGTPIGEVLNKESLFLTMGDSEEKIYEISLKINSDRVFLPILTTDRKIYDLVLVKKDIKDIQYFSSSDFVNPPVKKILVVGGAGYLGSVLVRKLIEKGYKVRVLDDMRYGREPLMNLISHNNFELIEGDARDIKIVHKSLQGVDSVIHLAGVVGDPACRTEPEEAIETNYFLTTILAQASKYNQINRFIFASTCSVYGAGDNDITETSKLNPLSLYARSKILSEQAILTLEDNNFSPTIMRMGTLYGQSPRMRFDLVVNILTKNAVLNNKIEIFGGDQWRPLLHVADAADAYIACLEAPIEKVKGQIFNVGSNEENYKINDIGEIVKRIVRNTTLINLDKEIIEGQMDKRSYRVLFDKIKNQIGFITKKNVEDGVLEIKNALEKIPLNSSNLI